MGLNIFSNADLKTALGIVNVARELIEAVDAIHTANESLQRWMAKSPEVSPELRELILQLDKAASRI